MRATQRRTAPHRTGLLCAVFGLTAVAGFAACTDAIHLDPPGATTGATTGGTGGSPAGSCRSSPDCALPKPVCDTVTQTCVECLTLLDCSVAPGPVCSAGKCVCLDTGLSYCTGEPPGCVDLQTSSINCGACGVGCDAGCTMGSCPTGSGGAGGAGPGTGGGDAGSSDAAGE